MFLWFLLPFARMKILLCKAVGQSFSGMETKMNEVGRTAIRIGAFHIARYTRTRMLNYTCR